MSKTWATIVLLALATAVIKGSGPLLLGGRRLPDRAQGVIALLAPPLLAALVVVQTLAGEGRSIHLDARLAALGAAGVAIWLRASPIVVVALAAATAAGLRAV